jgi:hypothetical protein
VLWSVPASAAPITYTIAFQPASGTPAISQPSAGGFTYDSSAATFTNFQVTWYGLVYDLTSAANAPTGSHSAPCFAGASGAAASFALLTAGACPAEWGAGNFTGGGGGSSVTFLQSTAGQLQFAGTREFNPNVPGDVLGDNFAIFGGFSVAPVTPPGVPEPASLWLLGTGAVALAARRRFTKRFHTCRGEAERAPWLTR